ncbi:Putative ribonuclease H protein At1g65750 [Linum perenne]
MDKKLADWKANNLSLAGRVTLASSVLNAIPSFVMQTAFLPALVCEAINKKIRDFIWGSVRGGRKIHNINWDTVCKPKNLGVWPLVINGMQWSIRDGKSTRFWTDRWVDSGIILADHALDIRRVDNSLLMSQACSDQGEWNLDFLCAVLPYDIVMQVIRMSAPKNRLGNDSLVWGLEPKGGFSVRTTYLMITDNVATPIDSVRRQIWN